MRSGVISILAGQRRLGLSALVSLLSLTGVLPLQAGVLSPALEHEIAGKRFDEPVKVLVLLQEDNTASFLDASLEREGATRRERHEKVVRTLQESAARTQAPILRELDTLRQSGKVLGYTPYWIVNGISVTGTVEAVRRLETRTEVEIIEPDVRTHLIDPTNEGAVSGSLRSIGISPGLLAIEAPRVWNELGVFGYGALVANMDSGVDGEHPALQTRWRGNTAPVDQCWRDAAAWGDVEPFDRIKHGTHVMGTMCGLAPDDTIGVAPGALWIADNTINQGSGTDFDNDVISGLQWFADPDGNPSTLIDVPDVVMHSWGVDESDSFFVDCDTRWWAAIDHCELAGVVQVWAAGNNGPDSSTVESPADRATNPRNAFSVGSTEQLTPYAVSSFSSRGPSGCGGPDSTKPEVVAPGETIYSAIPGNSYQQLSGTSMAGPHVAGIVALMRSANPNLGVNAIKNALMNTALDLGDPGDDNSSGRGMVNAYNAVQSVIATYGRVEGVVTDLGSGLPLPGARVEVFNDTRFTIADAAGFYKMPLPPGGRVLEISAPGYATESVFVQIVTGQPFDGSAALAPAATSSISGFVRDSVNVAVEGATVKALGTSFASAVSLGDGSFTLALPTGASYTLQARKNGFGSDVETVALTGAVTQDFNLPPLTAEDFESGDLLQWPWVTAGTLPWSIDGQEHEEGAFSARSGSIGDSESSTLEVTLSFVDGGDVSFWYRVSSQPGSDFLRFSIDGTEAASWSGLHVWTLATFSVGPGSHNFKWTYSKNSLISQGADAAWIDLVTFPALGVPPPPDVAVAPESLLVYLTPGATTDVPLSLDNLGIVDLNYAIAVLPDLPRPERGEREVSGRNPAAAARSELPAKGEPDLRPGAPPLRGAGGPDAFGHTWTDSDEPDGPIYNWVEINQVGTRILPMNDDTFSGPKQIGFTFPFYGLPYSSVRVSANGFVTFTSVPGSYWLNLALPDTTNPDNLIAAYWDDLNPLEGGAVYTYQDVANERFIVEWDDVSLHGSGGAKRETFQVHLYPNGIVLTQYRSVTADSSHTVGIEGPGGTDGLQVAMNAPYLQNQRAIRFSPHPAVTWLAVTPTAGTVAAAGNTSLNAHFDSGSLAEGTYQAVIRIVSNDPDESVLGVPATMIVSSMTGVEGVTHVPREVALSNPWPNPAQSDLPVTVRFAVPSGQESVKLTLYDVSGRRVRTLVDEDAGVPGFREVNWDRRDDGARMVSPGIYFVRLEVGAEERVAKVVVLR